VEVEIWSDIACPWCYIGKRRFEAALAEFEHRDEVNVTWRSFELDPGAPIERGGDRAEHLARTYGTSREQAAAMQDHMTSVAAAEGLAFRFDIARSGNTFDGHRLVHLASSLGLGDAMKERLLAAYLCEGQLISDHDVLRRLAESVGVPGDEVVETLASDRFASEVREDEALAASFDISAVPFFVVDRAFGAPGAQPPEILLKLLQRAWDARQPSLEVVSGGDACGPDGC
jgi:predicted DsbA family dithiol-disulfide isomerase